MTLPVDHGLEVNAVDTNKADDPLNVAVYVSMPDGVRIAVDIWLPDSVVNGACFPVAVEFTRYWRCMEGEGAKDTVRYLNQQGIACAVVDCRGSGASFGNRQYEHAETEVRDFAYVIGWLAKQAWSNGVVVSIGRSYSANTAELAMLDAPEALKASIPRFSDFDSFTDVGFPGGLLNRGFLKPWGEGVYAMDMNQIDDNIHSSWDEYRHRSVKPVDHDKDHRLLAQAITDHQANTRLDSYLQSIEYRDDGHNTSGLDGSGRALSPHAVQDNTCLQQIPSYHWASFTDAGTARGAIARFMGSRAPMRVIIGYWSHGAEWDTNPFNPMGGAPVPNIEQQFTHIGRYLDHLKNPGNDNHDSAERLQERALYYYTAGAERWQKTDTWPPRGTQLERWYFNADACLSQTPSERAHSFDDYAVDFDAGTGNHTRWDQMEKITYYPDRNEADQRLLCYTSAPLTKPLEITGHPVLSVQIGASQADGALIAYLEVVSPEGKVTVLTEGGLRIIHRKVCDGAPPYPLFGPYHSFNRQDAAPMPTNGEIVEIAFDLLPISVQLKPGDALRVALAGHDKDCFDRLPVEGEQHYKIYHQCDALSWMDIPVRRVNPAQVQQDSEDPFLFTQERC